MDKAASPVLMAAQRVLQRRMDVVANNIANLGTGGFRAQRMMTSESVTSSGGASVSLPRMASALTDTGAGEMTPTGGALDFAIDGAGFFMLQDADGSRFLTRSGSFGIDAAGRVTDAAGAVLLDRGGAPVVLPPGDGPVAAAADGTLSRGEDILGAIGIWDTADTPARRGAARFEAPGDAAVLPEVRVIQGMLERSNVSPVHELAQMIETSRTYALVQDLVEREDSRIRNVIETFARAS
ncbi:MAG: flagellar hook-basal body complex protein [Pseudomonadota bacterium]